MTDYTLTEQESHVFRGLMLSATLLGAGITGLYTGNLLKTISGGFVGAGISPFAYAVLKAAAKRFYKEDE